MSSLRRSLVLVTVGGSLCMLFLAAVNSPVFTEYVRALGATDLQIGLLSGLPMIMLAWQFVGAVIANRLQHRKPLFLVLIIAGRLLYLPIAILPFVMGEGDQVVDLIVILVALSAALSNVIGPAWFSWMADIIPTSILNRYWASRHRAQHLTWLVAYLAFGAFAMLTSLDVQLVFLVLAIIGVTAGVVDILLFIWVREPPNHIVKGEPILRILADPLKDRNFRTFVVFQCVWAFTALFSASFMMLYAIEGLGLGGGKATLVWCAMIMNALSAPYWGRLADKHGHKSIIAICVAMKPLVLLLFIFVTPGTALIALPIGFFIDSMWNAGLFVATNGYMMKVSPRRNRSVFVASITGLSGIFGGLGAICGGAFLSHYDGFHMELFSRDWNKFHLLFGVNFFMRIGCAYLVHYIKEPKSTEHDIVLDEMRGYWPMKFLLFPVGFYRHKVLPALRDTADTVMRNGQRKGKADADR